MKSLLAAALVLVFVVLASPAARAAGVLQSFTGATYADSGSNPPDPTIAVGPDNIIELTAGRYDLFANPSAADFSGTVGVPLQTSTLDDFWNGIGVTDPTGMLVDVSGAFAPRTYYDPRQGRFLVVSALGRGPGSQLLIAASKFAQFDLSKPPTANWTAFAITSDPSGNTWADSPTLGFDDDRVYMTANTIPVMGINPSGVQVVTITKLTLYNNAATSLDTFQQLLDPSYGFNLRPTAIQGRSVGGTTSCMDDSQCGTFESCRLHFCSPNERLVGSLSPGGGLVIAAMTHTAPQGTFRSVAIGFGLVGPPSPILDTGWIAPLNGHQPDGTTTLASGDGRVTSSLYSREGNIWTAQSVLGASNNDVIQYYEINEITGIVELSGQIAIPSLDLLNPSIVQDAAGDVAIGYTATGAGACAFASSYASVGTWDEDGTTLTFGNPILLKPGAASYTILDQGSNPWGHYSAMGLDPNDGSVWTVQELATGPSTWGTQISQLTPFIPDPVPDACFTDICDPVIGIVHTPISVDDGNACTADTCDPASGPIHTPISVDDGDACTTDTCDPASGAIHTPINPDDNDACTVDACDPVEGVTHTAISVDDGNPCTIDDCQPATGVTHTPGNSGALCRAAAGDCDLPGACDGVHASCPADQRVQAGTACRLAAGPCDVAEVCDGTSPTCPDDVFLPTRTVCRAAAGECDLSGICTGFRPDCPIDVKKPAATTCTDDGNPCTLDQCDGTSNDCQHPAGNVGAICRPVAGLCDAAETCTGTSTQCPADAFLPASAVCRGAVGVCDLAEICTGAGPACPPDAEEPAGTPCTDDGDPCTLDECAGTSVLCQHAIVAPGTTPACPQCSAIDDTACDGTSTPFCDVGLGICVQCRDTLDCPPDSACDPSSQTCGPVPTPDAGVPDAGVPDAAAGSVDAAPDARATPDAAFPDARRVVDAAAFDLRGVPASPDASPDGGSTMTTGGTVAGGGLNCSLGGVGRAPRSNGIAGLALLALSMMFVRRLRRRESFVAHRRVGARRGRRAGGLRLLG